MAGVAERRQRREELVRRAYYGLRASRRVAKDVARGRPLTESLQAEKPYFEAHRRAQKRRQGVAKAVDAAAEVYGPVLGWYSVGDDRVTPECRQAAGNNFRVDARPRIGFPGAGPHPNCRCHAGPPFPSGRMLG